MSSSRVVPALSAVPGASAAGASRAVPLIGFGHVWHRRLRPAVHAFRHASYFLMLPMRAWRNAPGGALARNRFAALAFRDADHGDGRGDALAWFEELLAAEGVSEADGEVWLLTYPRVLGHVFKPVSFWFALRRDGTPAAVLAEVNNTFGERHAYLLRGPQLRFGEEAVAQKVFHVSPFNRVEGSYRFRIQWPACRGDAPPRVLVRVDLDGADGAPLLQTSIGGALQPFTGRSARRAFFGVPLMTVGVVARIHWHALRLALKRVPFFSKPAPPERFITP